MPGITISGITMRDFLEKDILKNAKNVSDAKKEYHNVVEEFYNTVVDRFTWVDKNELKSRVKSFYYVNLDEVGISEYGFNVILSVTNFIRDITSILNNDKIINKVIDKMKSNKRVSGREFNIAMTRISKAIIEDLENIKFKFPNDERVIEISEFIAKTINDSIIEYAMMSYKNVGSYSVEITINRSILERMYSLHDNIHILHAIVGNKLYLYYIPDYAIEVADPETGEKKILTWLDREKSPYTPFIPYAFYEVRVGPVKLPSGIDATGIFDLKPTQASNTLRELGSKEMVKVSLKINPAGRVTGRAGNVSFNGVSIAAPLKALMLSKYASERKGWKLGRMNTGILQFAENLRIPTILYGSGVSEFVANKYKRVLILGPDAVYNDRRIFEELVKGNPEDYVIVSPPKQHGYVHFGLVETGDITVLGKQSLKLLSPETGATLYVTGNTPLYTEESILDTLTEYSKLEEKYIKGKKRISSIYSYVYPLPPPDTTQLAPKYWSQRRMPVYWGVIGKNSIAYTRDGRGNRLLIIERNPGEFYSTSFAHDEKENPETSIVEAFAFFKVNNKSAGVSIVRVNDLPVILRVLRDKAKSKRGADLPAPAVSFPFYGGDIEEERVHAYLLDVTEYSKHLTYINGLYREAEGLITVSSKTTTLDKEPSSPFMSIILGLFEDKLTVLLAGHEIQGSITKTRIRDLARVSFNYKDIVGELELSSEIRSEVGGASTLTEWASNLHSYTPGRRGIMIQPFTYYVSSRAAFTGKLTAHLALRDNKPYIIVEPPFTGVAVVFKLDGMRVRK